MVLKMPLLFAILNCEERVVEELCGGCSFFWSILQAMIDKVNAVGR